MLTDTAGGRLIGVGVPACTPAEGPGRAGRLLGAGGVVEAVGPWLVPDDLDGTVPGTTDEATWLVATALVDDDNDTDTDTVASAPPTTMTNATLRKPFSFTTPHFGACSLPPILSIEYMPVILGRQALFPHI